MVNTTASNRLRSKWQSLWHGRTGFRPGLVKLLWAFMRLWVGQWLWGTSVRLAHFSLPTKYVGATVALIAISLVAWAIWGVWQAVQLMGVRRLAILLVAMFALVVGFNVLTTVDERPFPQRLWRQILETTQEAGSWLGQQAQTALKAPDEFQFAYTGQRNPPALPPGFPTPDPEATPVQALSVPASSARSTVSIPTRVATATAAAEMSQVPTPAPPGLATSTPSKNGSLVVGGYAIVVNTGGQALRARDAPDTGADITARFEEGTRLQLLDGPETFEEFTWWQVRSEDGQEGWCADRWLSPTE